MLTETKACAFVFITRRKDMKKYRLIIAVAILLLLSGIAAYSFFSTKEETGQKEEETEKSEILPEEIDHTLINGCWKSEETADGRSFEFTINYPEAEDSNGAKGKIEYVKQDDHQYKMTINNQSEETVFFLGSLNRDNITLFYKEEGGDKEETINLIRSAPAAENSGSQENQSSSSEGSSSSGSKPSAAGTSGNKPPQSASGTNKPGSSSGSGKKGHYETRYETIPAYDEEVLVKEGYYEKVLVKDAWDEEDTYCYAWGRESYEGYECQDCGAQFSSGAEANAHLSESGHFAFHNVTIYTSDEKCLEYKTDYIHHDAVYDKVWHEPEYKMVHHPEETRSYEVWVED